MSNQDPRPIHSQAVLPEVVETTEPMTRVHWMVKVVRSMMSVEGALHLMATGDHLLKADKGRLLTGVDHHQVIDAGHILMTEEAHRQMVVVGDPLMVTDLDTQMTDPGIQMTAPGLDTQMTGLDTQMTDPDNQMTGQDTQGTDPDKVAVLHQSTERPGVLPLVVDPRLPKIVKTADLSGVLQGLVMLRSFQRMSGGITS